MPFADMERRMASSVKTLIWIIALFPQAGHLAQTVCGRPKFESVTYRGNGTEFFPGTVLHVECKIGYKSENKPKIICYEGRWSDPDPRCSIIQCKTVPYLRGGNFPKGPRRYKETIKPQCQKGFIYDGGTTMTCDINGNWAGTLGQCIMICETLKKGKGVILEPSNYTKRYNDTVTARCRTGYTLRNSSVRTCLLNGSWSGHDAQCDAVKCPTPEFKNFNGNIKYGDVIYGSQANVSCNEGYVLDGNNTIHCLPDGQWTTPGACKVSRSDEVLKQGLSLPLGITIAVIITIAIIAIILTGIIFRWRKKGKKNESHAPEEILSLTAYSLDESAFSEANRNRVLKRGHVITRWSDKIIDIASQFIDLRMVLSSPEEDGVEKTSIELEQHQNHMERLDLENIGLDSLLENPDNPDFVLLRGRAGVGKTTILHKVMYKWANRECSDRITLAALFSTRQLSRMQNSTLNRGISLERFLQDCSQHEIQLPKDWEANYESQIFKILICIDGVDEFQFFIRRFKDSLPLSTTSLAEPYQWCIGILKRQVLKKSILLITSRHFRGLKQLKSDRAIDVVGLTRPKIQEYIQQHVLPQNRERIKDIIFTNPIMLSVSTITFFCMMLCRALEDVHGSVHVDQDLYSYTRITSFIFKNLMERSLREAKQYESYSDHQVNSCLRKLSELAYQGLISNMYESGMVQLLFNDEDLEKAGISKEDVEVGLKLGLVICDDSMVLRDSTSPTTYTEFIHLSVQEILAMAHLLTQDEPTIESAVEKMWESDVFTVALPHLLGLFYDKHFLVKELMEKATNTSVPQHNIRKILYNILKSKEKIRRNQRLCAIQMAYESYKPEIASDVVELLYGDEDTIRFSDMTLTAVDLHGVFFAANHSEKINNIELVRLKDGDACLEDLAMILAKDRKIVKIGFCGTLVSENGLKILLDAVNKNQTISHLSLDATSLDDNKMGILAEFLMTNDSIKSISLARNEVSRSGMEKFVNAIKNNQTLETLILQGKDGLLDLKDRTLKDSG